MAITQPTTNILPPDQDDNDAYQLVRMVLMMKYVYLPYNWEYSIEVSPLYDWITVKKSGAEFPNASTVAPATLLLSFNFLAINLRVGEKLK